MHGRPVHQDLSESSPSHPNRWRILGVLVLALLVTSIDHTIINVALPEIVVDLNASAAQLQWIVAAYTVVFAGLLLTAGSLGDRFGRRHALAAGLATFMAGSILSALAGTATMLIAGRGVMGLGGALIMPTTLSIIVNCFGDPRERGQGHRDLDRRRRRRHRTGPDRRRLPHAQPLVVIGLLDQRPRAGSRLRSAPCTSFPTRGTRTPRGPTPSARCCPSPRSARSSTPSSRPPAAAGPPARR